MLLSFDILPEVLVYSFLFGVVYFLLYRRYIYAPVDLLFIFIFTTTFSSVLVVEVVEDVRYIIHYFVCQLCVFLGFALIQEWTGNPTRRVTIELTPKYVDKQLLPFVIYTLLVIYVICNFILLYTKGFALLSDAPSNNRVTNFQGGYGIFRKVNWAVGGVASTGLIFMYLDQSRRRDLALLIMMMLFTALEGSKGALVRYAIGFGALLYHPAFRQKPELLRQFRRFIPLGIVGVFGIFFTVLLKENSDPEEAFLAFVRRLLYGSDAVLYFYHPANVDYFSKFSFLDFPLYLFNTILGFLRLAPYQEVFGNIMVENTLPPGFTFDVTVGPNSSFYTEGQVFFGYYGAFAYSFALGALTGYIRSLYFSLTQSSAFLLVYISMIYQFSFGLLIDITTFITQTFDAIVLVLPIYLLVSFIVRRKIILWCIRFTPRINQ